ncbi:metallophosphoesterase family protein [Brevibacillus dissolubilis]|uniref:metallophosphoesterase family protein n=1 Tax=Brevibacillus dissolubilis TaxID=1844116 RepID=UPI001116209C|nr:metallophosphoesterase family protein [Brevibacillus dissolubilis]
MRIGIVADTHMPRAAKQLPQALRDGLAGVDLILHAGDFVTFDVVEALQQIAPLHGVYGNNDGPDMQARFPASQLLTLKGFHIGLVHGHLGKKKSTPERAIEAFVTGLGTADQTTGDGDKPAVKPDVIIFGHSHIPYQEEHHGILLFNPGSPTDKRRQPQFSYGIMELGDTIKLQHIFYPDKH